MHPKNLSIKNFIYHLPQDRIAFHPIAERDQSKILIYKSGNISTDIYQNIAQHLPEGALMIFNDTKVVEARLLFEKESGGIIEIFCLEPHEIYPDITTAMNQTQQVQWLCLVGGASKWKHGLTLQQNFIIYGKRYTLKASYIEKRADCFVISLQWDGAISFAEVLHHAGHVPLPPYIKRADEQEDKSRYQTVFARYDGSVAAPTAGLHFTEKIRYSLSEKNIQTAFVTLHVGAGTFKPVKAEIMQEHDMHAEFIEVEKSFIQTLISRLSEPVIAVGTTSLRTLESLYWLGYKLCKDSNIFKNTIPFISQWEVYDEKEIIDAQTALHALTDYLEKNNCQKLLAKTQIIIAPGYDFKIIKALVTNFHQPASTLLLLVAAFIGDDWKRVYKYALDNNFRFLSYGDGSLLWKK